MATVYQIVNDLILDELKKGNIPWSCPFKAEMCMPQNYVGRRYRGSNIFWLSFLGAAKGYNSPYWLTRRQIAEKGGRYNGAPTLVTFWNWIEDRKDPNRKVPLLRYYQVWNLDQCEGIPAPKAISTNGNFTPVELAENILSNTSVRPNIHDQANKASYNKALDSINMPAKAAFVSTEDYYSTLFHELVHATGHETRLNRDLTGLFGDHSYSKEELVAEMGAAYLMGMCGIKSSIPKNAAYIQSWFNALNKDHKLFISAASQAQKAVDLILGVKFENQEES